VNRSKHLDNTAGRGAGFFYNEYHPFCKKFYASTDRLESLALVFSPDLKKSHIDSSVFILESALNLV
jgi:hypothetical protein